MYGQQAIMIGLGWLVAPRLIERALAHGASWSLAGWPPSMTRKFLGIFRDGVHRYFLSPVGPRRIRQLEATPV